jgi:hypothetical protein
MRGRVFPTLFDMSITMHAVRGNDHPSIRHSQLLTTSNPTATGPWIRSTLCGSATRLEQTFENLGGVKKSDVVCRFLENFKKIGKIC